MHSFSQLLSHKCCFVGWVCPSHLEALQPLPHRPQAQLCFLFPSCVLAHRDLQAEQGRDLDQPQHPVLGTSWEVGSYDRHLNIRKSWHGADTQIKFSQSYCMNCVCVWWWGPCTVTSTVTYRCCNLSISFLGDFLRVRTPAGLPCTRCGSRPTVVCRVFTILRMVWVERAERWL